MHANRRLQERPKVEAIDCIGEILRHAGMPANRGSYKHGEHLITAAFFVDTRNPIVEKTS